MIATLPHKLRRLTEMSTPELSHRVRESARRNVERAAHRLRLSRREPSGRETGLPDSAGGSALRFLQETVATRSSLGVGRDRRALIARVRELLDGRLDEIAAEADDLCEHRVELLGYGKVALGCEIEWHRDPLTHEAWSQRFWADYDLVHEGPSDPKRVLELNRHQHLPRLAKASVLLDEPRYAQEAIAQLCDWIDHNPVGIGLHWHESLEIALRSISWIWTLLFLADSGVLTEADAARILSSLFAQLDHVSTYPSLYSSPNTHLLGEAAALYQAGILFSGCSSAPGWQAQGQRLLEMTDRQLLDDGVHAELSTAYHCYALDFCLQALAAAQSDRAEPPAGLREHVAGMARFLVAIRRPDGTLPLLGDDDGGRALALSATSYRDGADLLLESAARLADPSLAGPDCGNDGPDPARIRAVESSIWRLGKAGLERHDRPAAAPPGPRLSSFPSAGYTVLRSGWRRRDDQLVFAAGGLGQLGGGHGHADALSITLSAAGSHLLIDPGTCVYNRDRPLRDAFRGTAAHNTVVIDQRDQVEPTDTFRWRGELETRTSPPQTFVDATGAHRELFLLAGEHDGYRQAPTRLIHRRRVLHPDGEYWLLLDDFRRPPETLNGGDPTHDFLLPFHLAPDARLQSIQELGDRAARCLVTVDGVRLAITVVTAGSIELRHERASSSPRLGWVSTRYGRREPATVVWARFEAEAPAFAMTLIEVAPDGSETTSWPRPVETLDHSVLAGGKALGALVRSERSDDLILLGADPHRPLAATPRREGCNDPLRLEACSEALWARFSAGTSRWDLERLLAIGATRVTFDGSDVARRAEPGIEHHLTTSRHPAGRP